MLTRGSTKSRVSRSLPGWWRGQPCSIASRNVQGKLTEAIAAYREAIRHKPDFAEAHCNLGVALRSRGEYAAALDALRTGHTLGSKRADWRYPSAAWVAETERMTALATRLPALLKGDDRPQDVAERLALAQMCYDTKRHAAAAGCWTEALAADPKLGDDRQAGHRYNAACAAALAGSGQGTDDPKPDDAARARLRGQALDWLKAEQAAWAKMLDSGDARARPFVAQNLQHWQADPDLAGVRDRTALAALPEAERADWEALWAEVDRLLGRAGKAR
jgi:eukaryotic-like serine/threonine-protein kinase